MIVNLLTRIPDRIGVQGVEGDFDMNIKLLNGNVLDMLKTIADESVDCIASSPPYYGLRSYKGADTIWGGNPGCEHEWISQQNHKDNLRFRDPNHVASVGNNKNAEIYSNPTVLSGTCSKCGAWKGQLGLEPSYQMYIDHLMLVMKELKRVLKKTGTLYWNMADGYASSGGPSRHKGYSDPKYPEGRTGEFEEPTAFDQGIPAKSLMMIPERFALAMIDDGWILRNKLIWYSRNKMPESASDRWSRKYEFVYFFTKSNEPQFWIHDITHERVNKKPLGTHGREGIDFIWKMVRREEVADENGIIPKRYRKWELYELNGVVYLRRKVSLWSGHDYYFNLDAIKTPITYIKRAFSTNHIERRKDKCLNIYAVSSLEQDRYYSKIREQIKLGMIPYKNPGDVMGSNDPETVNNSNDILDIVTRGHLFSHFAIFPEALVEPLLKAGCPPDGVVLDPFAGSGTVGVAALKQNKSSILIEISPEYCNIIKKRLDWGVGLDVEYEHVAGETVK